MVLWVGELGYGRIYDLLEGILPNLVEFLQLLIPHYAVTVQVGYEVLTGLCVFLGHQSLLLDMRLSILLRFFVVALTGDGRENSRRRQDLVEVLELLTSSLLVTISHWSIIDLVDIGESVDNKGTKEHRIWNFIAFNWQTGQIGECLQLGNLNETVDVVVLEEEGTESLESLQLGNVGWPDDVVKAHILEGDLLDCLLEFGVVQHF